MIQLRTEGFPFTPLNSNRKKELEFGEYSETREVSGIRTSRQQSNHSENYRLDLVRILGAENPQGESLVKRRRDHREVGASSSRILILEEFTPQPYTPINRTAP